MSKKKVTTKTIDLPQEDANFWNDAPAKAFLIKKAEIKDGICNYAYEVNTGVHRGDVVNVKGTALFLRDLDNAFQDFNVHLACIDQVFKISGIEVEDINLMRAHELVFEYRYNVTRFELKGTDENLGIILTGTKHTDLGRYDITTPKIMIGAHSSYLWYNELRDVTNKAIDEVEQYIGGKCERSEDDEQEPDNSQQGALNFNSDGNEENIFEHEHQDNSN